MFLTKQILNQTKCHTDSSKSESVMPSMYFTLCQTLLRGVVRPMELQKFLQHSRFACLITRRACALAILYDIKSGIE